MLFLTSCGGGSSSNSASAAICRPTVISGFSGNFDDLTVPVPYDPAGRPSGDGGGGGGEGGGAGGGAGAGAGGSLGQFLNAVVRVERSDGSLLGEAVTDSQKGLVTVVPCSYNGPLHIKVTAKPGGGSKYYEESTGQYADFPVDQEMHAVVPSADKNMGITLLTEAAWQYLLAKHGPDGWKNVDHINEANNTIRDEFNKFLPKDLQITDITRLPFLVGGDTAAQSIDTTNANGVYGIVSSGLARAAGLLRSGDIAPALKLVRQLGRDLCDGNIDLACNGAPVVADTKDAAYLPTQFAETLNRGVGDVAATCGTDNAKKAAFRVTQISILGRQEEDRSSAAAYGTYHDKQWIVMLGSDGKMFFWPERDASAFQIQTMHRFNRLFPQSDAYIAASTSDGNHMVGVIGDLITGAPQLDPALRGATTLAGYYPIHFNQTAPLWNFAQIARLPDGRARFFPHYTSPSIAVSKEPLLSNITSVALTFDGINPVSPIQDTPMFLASTANGDVYQWASNYLPGVRSEPEKVPGLPPVTAVVAISGTAMGIDRAGRVWAWSSRLPSFPTATANLPQRVTGFDAFGPVQQIHCGLTMSCIALTRSGEMLAWGTFGSNNEYLPPELRVEPKQFSVSRVPLPAGRRVTYLGASLNMVYGLLDDGTIVVFPTYPNSPKFLDTRSVIPDATDGSAATCKP